MKKYIVFILIPVFVACGRSAREKAQELQARNDSLVKQTEIKDVALKEFIASVDEVQNILDSIKFKENIISHGTKEMGAMQVSAKDKVRGDMKLVYEKILKDQRDLADLSRKLHSSGVKMKEFQKLIDHLQQDIEQKNSDLAMMKGNLDKMNVNLASAQQRIDTLNTVVLNQNEQISNKDQTIEKQTTAINTAYYIIGTGKELRDKGIIKGGKIAPNFNRMAFRKLDITKTLEIPLEDAKVKVLSNHPSESFKLIRDGNKTKSLEVVDYSAFWSTTKFLVLETNKPVSR